MLLGLIFSILTATYSLSSTTHVEASGDIPEYSTYYYARSAEHGQKGQITAGNSTCLTLTGWDGCTIQSIALQMRSNTTSGTGSLTVKIGENKVWEIHNQSFEHSSWYGAFSTEWVSIQHTIAQLVKEGETIEIIISATENSLYCLGYTIAYEPAAPTTYTVEFITGLDTVPPAITQPEIGSAIVLPQWVDTIDWYFLGWSTKEVEHAQQCPEIMPAGTIFTPKKNTRLWAVYSDNGNQSATTTYESGEYILAQINPLTEQISGEDMGWAMYDIVHSGEVPLRAVSIVCDEDSILYLQSDISTDMIYTITFLSDSTLTIKYTKTGESIGYSGQTLSSSPATWNYHILRDGSLAIYYAYGNKNYALWLGFGAQANANTAVAYAQQIALHTWQKDGFWLFPAILSNYTSWPFGKWDAIEKIEVDSPLSSEYVFHFGQYQLQIIDGKKYLRIAH